MPRQTMYQLMNNGTNQTLSEPGNESNAIAINYIIASTHGPYGINCFRIGRAVGNLYYTNIGWGTAQSFGCNEHTGGEWGVNVSTCTMGPWDSNDGAKVFIR